MPMFVVRSPGALVDPSGVIQQYAESMSLVVGQLPVIDCFFVSLQFRVWGLSQSLHVKILPLGLVLLELLQQDLHPRHPALSLTHVRLR